MSRPMTCAPARAAGIDWFPGTASHVQHFRPRLQMKARNEFLRSLGIQLCDLAEVAGHPRGPQALFQLHKTLWQTAMMASSFD